MCSGGPLHIDEQRLDDQLELIYNRSVLIQDVAWKTSQEQWMIEMSDERGSGRSVLAAGHDDDDGFFVYTQLNVKIILFQTTQFSSI